MSTDPLGPSQIGEPIAAAFTAAEVAQAYRVPLAELDPMPVPWERLDWLTEIPPAERPQWVMAPVGLSYAQACDWAIAKRYAVIELLHLTSGDTLIRLLDAKPARG
jgi:hypothetical protein